MLRGENFTRTQHRDDDGGDELRNDELRSVAKRELRASKLPANLQDYCRFTPSYELILRNLIIYFRLPRLIKGSILLA